MSHAHGADGQRTLRVIVADDDSLIRTMIADGLARCDVQMEVMPCADGVKALVLVRALRWVGRPVDLVITDFEMQVMHGDKLAQAIRQDEHERRLDPVPIVFVTSLEITDDRLREALRESAPAVHIHKKNCRDGMEIASRIVELAKQRFSITDNR